MSDRIFIDTSAYYALTDPDAREHGQARAAFARLTRDGAELYTSNFVTAETHTLILNRVNRDIAARVLDGIHASSTRIIRATERDETRAREIIHTHHDKAYSMVDAISFAVMERLHLRLAWAYDHHFSQYGLVLVR